MTTGRAVPAESSIIADFMLQRYRVKQRLAKERASRTILLDTGAFPFLNGKPLIAPMQQHKNKTLATALAFLLGGLGVHRFYLKGSIDRIGLLHVCSIPAMGLVYGLGRGPNPFYVLLPLIVSCIAGFIEALVIGLTPDERWDAQYNAASGRNSRSHWFLALLLVLTMLVGATVLIAALSRLFDLLYTGGAYG
jgi:hypothetical protein